MSTAAALDTKIAAETQPGSVTLAAQDPARLADWYGKVLGFAVQGESADRIVLGAAGGAPLLQLTRAPQGARRHDPRDAGLFHVAYLLPSRLDLGRWLGHVAAGGFEIEGASDHLVSEAIYLSDPEGNGIEVYRDRPRADWPRQGGALVMATDPLNLQALLTEGRQGQPWTGAPEGTVIGHVHLKAAELDATKRFYVDALGFDVVMARGGALFVSAGGYHHHLGLNVWQSRGRPRQPGAETGLAETRLVLGSAYAVEAAAARLAAAGFATTRAGADRLATDPSGLTLRLSANQPDAAGLLAG